MRIATSALTLILALEVAAAAGEELRLEAPARAREWSRIPAEEQALLWEAAQNSGSVLVVEPDSQAIGQTAASKKTWAVADVLLKFFVYGFQPNWFPADVVRRTACGADPRWSYFWHLASGDERDLHPWVDGAAGFSHLVGSKTQVLLASKALDLSACREVYGPEAGEKPCLYGEVTAPSGFESWFCGGRGSECRTHLLRAPRKVPPDLAEPEVACVHGPWVLERAHDLRPEIHPAEVTWVRKAHAGGHWTFALVPDDSGRFRKEKHYEKGPKPAGWTPWSHDRPVELWIAFSSPAAGPLVFDLSVKAFDKKPHPAQQVLLRPPAPAADFSVLPHALSSVVTAAARTWAAGPGALRGLLVLRTRTANSDRRALVLRLRGRDASAPEAPVELAPGVDPVDRALEPPTPKRIASVRLLGFTRIGPGLQGRVRVNTLVRFDPARPAEPADEERAEALNEALRGSRQGRIAAFGTDRPFRVEWEVLPADVRAATSRGPATSSVVVTNRDASATLSAQEGPIYLGTVDVVPPMDGLVTGEGRVLYEGREVGLTKADARVVFKLPSPRFANEWDLVLSVLREVDESTAAGRLAALQSEACAPAPAAECGQAPIAASVSQALGDPVKRWEVMRELSQGERPFARFVQLFSRALLWDGEVEAAEGEKLKSLLATDGTVTASSALR